VEDYLADVGTPLAGMRIGVLRTELDERCHPDVMKAYQTAQSTLVELGCELVDIELPHLPYGVAAYYLVAPAEASSNLARFDGMRYGLRVTGDDLRGTYEETRDKGFGPEVKRRIMLGTYALSAGYYDAYYLKAQRVRTLIRRDYERVFEKCDTVLSPTAPGPAFRLGEKVNDPLTMYLEDVFTLPPSLSGLPAISTPSGLSQGGLPLGVQFTTPALTERLLVKIADAFERAQSAPLRAPNYVEE
jgi:aspartyl-tRNA(Asn)/glutamyl-tRNA(Gln) amidotransferase subunit A